MISYELWMNGEMFDVAINRELPRLGEIIVCTKGSCKVKRVVFLINSIPKVYVEKEN